MTRIAPSPYTPFDYSRALAAWDGSGPPTGVGEAALRVVAEAHARQRSGVDPSPLRSPQATVGHGSRAA